MKPEFNDVLVEMLFNEADCRVIDRLFQVVVETPTDDLKKFPDNLNELVASCKSIYEKASDAMEQRYLADKDRYYLGDVPEDA